MDVAIRAKRILKPMDRFRLLSEFSKEENLDRLSKEEICIGVYENGDNGKGCVFITNKGLLVRSNEEEQHVLFSDIADVHSPSDKQDDYVINLVLLNGRKVSFEIRGARGRFRDVFEFTRFLDRVVSDIAS
jgi:hypothetical protein